MTRAASTRMDVVTITPSSTDFITWHRASDGTPRKATLDTILDNSFSGTGTLTLNGTNAVTVNSTAIATTSMVLFSLNTVGGTVGAIPTVKTINAGVNMTVAGTASDTSVYNYKII